MCMMVIRAPIVQGYGLTETCCGGAFSEFDDTSVGRVGPPLPCCFVKVSNKTHVKDNQSSLVIMSNEYWLSSCFSNTWADCYPMC